ncbi:MAG: lectin-like protein [Verrucomicrobium sp.]
MKLLIAMILLFSCGNAQQVICQVPASPRPPFKAPADAKFINGRWFAAIMEKLDWNRAKSKCEALGGRLAIIRDEDTWKKILTLTPSTVWLGATDSKTEGQWRWVDDSLVTFTVWVPGQPDNQYGIEHYLSTWKGGWNDRVREWDAGASGHDNPVVGYICEWPAK